MTDPLYHDSRNIEYRSPFGAIRESVTVRLRMGILDGFYVTDPRAVINDGSETVILPMSATGKTLDGYHLVECEFTPEKIGHYWIYFAAEDGVGTRTVLCNKRSGAGGSGRIEYGSDITPYLLTVYDKAFDVPDWFRGRVMYQIFPDRFNKSGKEHPPKPRMHDDWYEEPAITPFEGQEHYQADDFFGGDIEGIIQKLDYIKSLGVGVIYLNPIFSSISNHRYNTSDYGSIDSLLGDENDFKRLCGEAKKRGIYIMLDGVFSHTGSVSRYFHSAGISDEPGAADSVDSKYYSWYRFGKWNDDYECWWGDRSLPNVNETEPSYMEYILGENGIVRKWIRAGAKGFRLDVADELPDEFIFALYNAAKAEDPEAVVMGEVWENAATKEAYGVLRRYVTGDELSSVMNYPYRSALLDFLMDRHGASEVSETVLTLKEQYPEAMFCSLMNMTGSHDVPRLLSVLSGVDTSDLVPRERLSALEPSGEMLERGKKLVKLYIAAIMTLPGVPSIYYGDEAGMTGLRDPFCRRTFPWGREDTELTRETARLSAVRGAYPEFAEADIEFIDAGEELLLYKRGDITVAINRDGETRLSIKASRGATDLVMGEYHEATEGVSTITVPECSYMILKRD